MIPPVNDQLPESIETVETTRLLVHVARPGDGPASTLASSPDAHPQLPYMQVPELTSLRQQIDAIDEELVELLSRRFRITDRVGQLKAEQGLHAVDPVRESQQAQRLHELAARHGVTATLVNHIFRAVVDQVVSNHQSIAAARHPAKQ